MQGATATAVAALIPDLLLGVATAGGLGRVPSEEAELPAFLADLDAQAARLHAHAAASPLAVYQERLGIPATLSADLSESMLRVSAFRDLPRRLQAHPEMQRRVRRELPRLGQQVLRMTMALRDLPERSRRDVRRLLRENPELRPALRERRRASFAQLGLAHERARQTDRLMDHLLFRLERQPAANLLDELVGKMRRASADVGVREEDWRALADQDLDGMEIPEDGTLILAMDEEVPPTEPEEPTEPDAPAEEPRDGNAPGKLFGLGAIVAGVGGGSVLIGLALMNVAEGLGVFLTIVGGVIFMVGLLILGLAVVVTIFEAINAENAEQVSLRLPEELLARVRVDGLGSLPGLETATL